MWPFSRKPKTCPKCGLPYTKLTNVAEWYTGGWISGCGKKVPLLGHATYNNGQMFHYEFPWQDISGEPGEINLGLMPKHVLICGCGTK